MRKNDLQCIFVKEDIRIELLCHQCVVFGLIRS